MINKLLNDWKSGAKAMKENELEALVDQLIEQGDFQSLYAHVRDDVFINKLKAFDVSLCLGLLLKVIEAAHEHGDMLEVAEFSLIRGSLTDLIRQESPLDAIRVGDLKRAEALVGLHANSYEWRLLCLWLQARNGDIQEVKTLLKTIFDGHHIRNHRFSYRAFADVYQLLDFEEEHKKILCDSSLDKVSELLLKQGNIDKALIIAHAIEYDKYRFDRLSDICKSLIQPDRCKALAVAEQAVSVAQSFDDEERKSDALLSVAEIAFSIDKDYAMTVIEQAIAAADRVEESEWSRNWRLGKIIVFLLPIDLIKATEVANLMSNSDGHKEVLKALLDADRLDEALEFIDREDYNVGKVSVVQKLVHTDFDRAWKLATEMDSDSGLVYIVGPLYQRDKAKAIAIYEQIESSEKEEKLSRRTYGNHLMYKLVSEFAPYDLKKVLVTLQWLEADGVHLFSENRSRECLNNVALQYIPTDLNRAIDFARSHQEHVCTTAVLSTIVEATPMDDLDASSPLFQKIIKVLCDTEAEGEYPGERCGFFTEVAKLLIPTDLKKAWGFIDCVYFVIGQSYLNELAMSVAPFDADMALKIERKSWESVSFFSIGHEAASIPEHVDKAVAVATSRSSFDEVWKGKEMLYGIAHGVEDQEKSLHLYEKLLLVEQELCTEEINEIKLKEVMVETLANHHIDKATELAKSLDVEHCEEVETAIIHAKVHQNQIDAVKDLVPWNINSAWELVESISDAEKQTQVLTIIMNELLLVDESELNLLSNAWDVTFNYPYSELVGMYARINLADALILAGKLYESEFDTEPNYIMDRGEPLLIEDKNEPYDFGGPMAYTAIVKQLISIDIQKALVVAFEIEDNQGQAEAVSEIKDVLSEESLQQMADQASLVKNPETRELLLNDIEEKRGLQRKPELEMLRDKAADLQSQGDDWRGLREVLLDLIPLSIESALDAFESMAGDEQLWAASVLAESLMEVEIDITQASANSFSTAEERNQKVYELFKVVIKHLNAGLNLTDKKEMFEALEQFESFDKPKSQDLYHDLFKLLGRGAVKLTEFDTGGLLKRSVYPESVFDKCSRRRKASMNFALSIMWHYSESSAAIADMLCNSFFKKEPIGNVK